MKIQAYDSTLYNSWEEAEQMGGTYSHYLTDTIVKKIPKNMIEELAEGVASLVTTCIQYDKDIKCRVVKE